MRILLTFLLFIGFGPAQAQLPTTDELHRTLASRDSLMFDAGFRACDLETFGSCVSENFEFYHDRGGITSGKAAFVESMRKNICGTGVKVTRKLVPNTLETFPLFNNGVLYGAIQHGRHDFYQAKPGMPAVRTGTARFTHLWLLENGEWKFARGLSYDHQEAHNP